MRIQIQHRFERTDVNQVEQLYLLDEDFNARTFVSIGYQRKLSARTLDANALTRVLCLTPLKPLPPPFGALAPEGLFRIEESIQYDLGRHAGTWRTVPSVLANQFRASGTLQIAREGADVLFTLEGEVNARIPLLSRLAERQALKTAQNQHAALAQAVRSALRGAGRPDTSAVNQDGLH